MLSANLMIGTNDRPLEQRPDVLHYVRVNYVPLVFAVVYGSVKRIVVSQTLMRKLRQLDESIPQLNSGAPAS